MKQFLTKPFTRALGIVLLLGAAFAQDDNVVISPQSIVVNPTPSFEVDVSVDKEAPGDQAPVYTIGESIRIGVEVSEASYVYLFNVKSNGEVTQILPNRLDQAGENNFIEAGQTKFFPPQNAGYTFDIAGPRGLDKVIAVASKDQLDTSTLARFGSEGAFAESQQTEESFAQTLSIVVNPVASSDWVTDTALFYVGQRPEQPRFGTIVIRSNPGNARALVDGQFVGRTPVRFGTTAGQHDVRVELGGYSTFTTTVNLSGDQTLEISASLSQVQRQGSLFLQANVGGAEVFVDGSRVGTVPSGSGELTVSDLSAGQHQLRISAPGFTTIERTFTVEGGQTTQVSVSQERLEPTSQALYDYLGLSDYPGATVRRLEQDNDSARVDLDTSARPERVFDHFSNQLVSSGWQRTRFEVRGNSGRYEAEYSRRGEELELKLDRRGASGSYRLELELDD